MFCKNCGSQVEDGVKFCPNCGADMEENVAEQATSYTSEVVETESGSGTQDFGQQDGAQTGYQQNDYRGPEFIQPGLTNFRGTNRNIALCIVFSIISCGIYSLYWMYVLNEEMNAITGDSRGTSGGLVILFSILTCGIYTWYWYYKMGEKVDFIKERSGMPSSSSPILFLILGIFGLGIVNFALMQDTINKLAE